MSLSRVLRREEGRQKPSMIPTVRTHPRDVIRAMRKECLRQAMLNLMISRVWGWDEWEWISFDAVDLQRV